jgi:hypothetical protein
MAKEMAIQTRDRTREDLRYGKGTVAEGMKGPEADMTEGESHMDEMGGRHGKEMHEMHGRHAKEMEGMHERHASEHKSMMNRHHEERGGGRDTRMAEAPGAKKDEKKAASTAGEKPKEKHEGDGKAA